jgi:hypothetical protein
MTGWRRIEPSSQAVSRVVRPRGPSTDRSAPASFAQLAESLQRTAGNRATETALTRARSRTLQRLVLVTVREPRPTDARLISPAERRYCSPRTRWPPAGRSAGSTSLGPR